MIDSYEFVKSRAPFVVRRRVRWGECDPAGVVYTGRFTEYLLGAVNLFLSELAGGDYAKWLAQLGIDSPCKGMEFTFHYALWPEDDFDMTCTVTAIRESAYDIGVEAMKPDGQRIFTGRFSPVCISREVRKRTPMPAVLRGRLEQHMKKAA